MKAKRFSGARRQDADSVAPCEYSLDQLALAWTKMLDAEALNGDCAHTRPRDVITRIKIPFGHKNPSITASADRISYAWLPPIRSLHGKWSGGCCCSEAFEYSEVLSRR